MLKPETSLGLLGVFYLWESSVVPNVSVMREAVGDVAELLLLDVLLDRIQRLLRCNLRPSNQKLRNTNYP
jgi:hypothetical protein